MGEWVVCGGLEEGKGKKMRMEYVNARTLKWNEGKKRETITSTETFVFYCCTITRDVDDNRQTWQWHTNRQHFTLRWNFVVSVMRRHSIGNILRSRANAAEQMIQSNNNINNDSSFGKQPNERTNEWKQVVKLVYTHICVCLGAAIWWNTAMLCECRHTEKSKRLN